MPIQAGMSERHSSRLELGELNHGEGFLWVLVAPIRCFT